MVKNLNKNSKKKKIMKNFNFKKKNLKRVMVRDGICGVTVDALKTAVAISNLSYVVSGTLSAPIPNFIQI